MSKHEKRQQDFLGDDCGQNALQLAARGSALIAEILRLTEHIPNVFLQPDRHVQYKYIVSDFSYFNMQDAFEKRVQSSKALLDLDDEFRETHIELLERFFTLFRGVHGYATEVNRFVADIKDCQYLSQSLESVLAHPDGKQLLGEIYYLYGVMLLLFDRKLGGKVREYLIVSFIRYKGASDQVAVDVVNLCRSTGFELGKSVPDRYPETYFRRVPLDHDVLGAVIGRVRSDDIYQMAYHYPAPEHRSTAFASQAAMLYVLLNFCPSVLHEERQMMREIVDKHFVDNWVLPFYLGFTVDLTVAWKPFKAAHKAILGTVAEDNVLYYLKRHVNQLQSLRHDLDALLREGVLTEQYVLENIYSTLLPKVREANVTLRWCVLHTTRGPWGREVAPEHKRVHELIAKAVKPDDVLTVLLSVAQLEFTLKIMFQKLLKQKRRKWEEAKQQASTKMGKLSKFYSGEHVLSDNVRIGQLQTWFADIEDRIDSMTYTDSTSAGRKLQKLMKALENVQEFHHIDENLQVVQFLHDTRHLLRQMFRYINIERKVLITIGTIGDISYAWELFADFGCFVNEVQEKIKRTPQLVLRMRSAFIKFATLLELPCNRIDQASESDPSLSLTLESVSEYYSAGLVDFVRKVLHVIPSSIFKVLRTIKHVLVEELEPCTTKVPKSMLKDVSQLPTRLKLSRLTAEVSEFAAGILAMESTLVGVIQVDPHQLLEDGIRKELVAQISGELDRVITFDPKRLLVAEEFDNMLSELQRQLLGMRDAFEYVQDYVNVHGLRLWLEEFSRIVNFNVDMECNAFMTKKIYHWNSRFQSERIPIPHLRDPLPSESYSFLGRLTQHLLRMTRNSIYIPALGAWFDPGSGRQAVGERTFHAIASAIGPQGLAAMDRLVSFIIAKELDTAINRIRHETEELSADLFGPARSALLPTSGIPKKSLAAIYEKIGLDLPKLNSMTTDALARIGRMQLIRRLIAKELRSRAKMSSGTLFGALANANGCLLSDLDRHYSAPLEHPMPGEIVAEISPLLEAAGLTGGGAQVYVTVRPLPDLPFLLTSLLRSTWSKYSFSERLQCLVPAKPREFFVDAAALCVGVMAILRQFHSDAAAATFGLLAQVVRVMLGEHEQLLRDGNANSKSKTALPESALTATRMLEAMCEHSGAQSADLAKLIPSHLLCETTVN